MSQQKVKIQISKKYKAKEREAIAQEILLFIIERSKNGKDKNGRKFPKYSKEYIKSLDFKNAGKSKSRIDLTLSDEMLNSLEILKHKPGEIVLGFDKNDEELNAKAEGNILGTYGQKSPIPGKKRDFLGISKKDLNQILKNYPIKDREQIQLRTAFIDEVVKGSDNIALTFQDLDEEFNEFEDNTND